MSQSAEPARAGRRARASCYAGPMLPTTIASPARAQHGPLGDGDAFIWPALPPELMEEIARRCAARDIISLGLTSRMMLRLTCRAQPAMHQRLLQRLIDAKDTKAQLALLQSRWAREVLPHCKALVLSDLRLRPHLAAALLGALAPATRLQNLDLSDNPHGCRALLAGLRGVEGHAGLPRLPALQRLSLRDCGVDTPDLARLVGLPQLGGLTEVELRQNYLRRSAGRRGPKAIAA